MDRKMAAFSVVLKNLERGILIMAVTAEKQETSVQEMMAELLRLYPAGLIVFLRDLA